MALTGHGGNITQEGIVQSMGHGEFVTQENTVQTMGHGVVQLLYGP